MPESVPSLSLNLPLTQNPLVPLLVVLDAQPLVVLGRTGQTADPVEHEDLVFRLVASDELHLEAADIPPKTDPNALIPRPAECVGDSWGQLIQRIILV
ncbi:hypothetical protein VTK56DRAFT_2794 [Thermocarpiscus australiensis]